MTLSVWKFWICRDKIGKEYITLYDTQQTVESGDLFYTDANGREILQRRYHQAFDDKNIVIKYFQFIKTWNGFYTEIYWLQERS